MRDKVNSSKIACVIVTYNRKVLLKRCLDAVTKQTFKPCTVFIMDNASTDGTIDSVKEWGYYECQKNGIQFKYILNIKNEGGAGGFYLGMKTAFESGEYDAVWIMDDDGSPKENCLELLNNCRIKEKRDYIAPVVLSDEDRDSCSFWFYPISYSDFCKRANEKGLIENFACPFNAILLSAKLIRTIGYPKKEMFIWGDEINYHNRAIKAGMIPVTVTNAIHYHPKDRQKFYELRGKYKVMIVDKDWKLYCFIRNHVYNWRFSRFWYLRWPKRFFKLVISYLYYYNKLQHDSSKNWLIIDAALSGLFGRFSGLTKYMNK